MNKALLVKRLGRTFVHLPEAQLHHMMHTVIALLGETLVRGERIEIRGFGSFVTKNYPPRLSHNPRTGGYTMSKVRVKPLFRASSVLLNKLNTQTDNDA